MDVDECIKMLNKAKSEGNDKIVLDIMSKKADSSKFYAKRSIQLKDQTQNVKEHLPRAAAKEDLPF